MDQSSHERLCDELFTLIAPPTAATHRDLCRCVGRALSELLAADVELCFVNTPYAPDPIVTASRRHDGTYLICYAGSPTWRSQLGTLLCQLTGCVLARETPAPPPTYGYHRIAPNLPINLLNLMTPPTIRAPRQDHETRALAACLLTRLTCLEPTHTHTHTPTRKLTQDVSAVP